MVCVCMCLCVRVVKAVYFALTKQLEISPVLHLLSTIIACNSSSSNGNLIHSLCYLANWYKNYLVLALTTRLLSFCCSNFLFLPRKQSPSADTLVL